MVGKSHCLAYSQNPLKLIEVEISPFANDSIKYNSVDALSVFKKHKNYSIGMIIAHLGVGLLILGITGSSVWQKEKITRMKINGETKIEKYNIVFEKINEIRGPNYVALQGNFLVYDEKRRIITRDRICNTIRCCTRI